MTAENISEIKEFLKKALYLESTIYTCNKTEAKMNNILSRISQESRTVEEYKYGDCIPYEDGIKRSNNSYMVDGWFGTRHESTYDRQSARYRRFHTADDMINGYSCPKKSSYGHIRKFIESIKMAAIPAVIMAVIGAVHYGFDYGYDNGLFGFLGKIISLSITFEVIVAVVIYVFKAFIIKYEGGFKEEHDFYINKLNERNAKLAVDSRTLEYCNETIKKNSAICKKAINELQNHYKNSPIYPKYHNFVSVAQILEYLESGRCDSLIGATGAYNLFESELRSNIIICKLDEISNLLTEIRDTQYLICDALQSTDMFLGAIDIDIQNLQKSVDVNTETINRFSDSVNEQLNHS